MKKLFLLAAATISLITSSFTSTESLKWLDFNEGYALAKKKNKIMLVDVYTDWCGWCKVMDRDTYAKKSVVDLINKDFIAIKFNPEKRGITYNFEGKNYTGQELAGVISNYQISGYPTTIFLYPKDKKMNVIGGFQNEINFKGILQEIRNEYLSKK